MKRFCSVILSLFAVAGASADAQALRVRLVNGSNGKLITSAYINVWVGDQRKDAVPIPIASNGQAILSLTSSQADAHVQTLSSPWQVFPYAPEIRVQVGFALCQTTRQKYSWLQVTPYSTPDWVRTGIVTANTCGHAMAKPEPGVLTIFVRPLTFWEKLSE